MRKLTEEHKVNIRKILNTPEVREKISNALKGRPSPNKGNKHSSEFKIKMSKLNEGEKNYFWRGGISFEPYGIEFNNKLKQQIRKRDNYKCQICDISENGRFHDVHHIDYKKKNNIKSNLITLCHSCHAKTNYNRKYWESYFKGETSCQLQLSI